MASSPHRRALIIRLQYPSGDSEWSKASPVLTHLAWTESYMTNVTYKSSQDSGDGVQSFDSGRCVGICVGGMVGVGGFGDVYKGSFCSTSAMKAPNVAVKVIRRSLAEQNAELQQKLRRAIVAWQMLDHPNIVPICGISSDFDSPTLISQWMCNGDALSYLEQNAAASRMDVIIEVARGLEYLHSHQVVHGDIKGANILVDNLGTARLGDFGLVSMLRPETILSSAATSIPGTVRWMAPELLDGTQENVTRATDVYSFAVTCWEVMTGNEPFSDYYTDGAVMAAMMIENKRPSPRPDKLDLDIWMDMQSWWDRDPGCRHDMQSINKRMEDICNRKGGTLPASVSGEGDANMDSAAQV